MARLKKLTSDQLEQITRIAHELSTTSPPAIPQSLMEQAVQNGWPATLFTEVIGQIEGGFERPSDLI